MKLWNWFFGEPGINIALRDAAQCAEQRQFLAITKAVADTKAEMNREFDRALAILRSQSEELLAHCHTSLDKALVPVLSRDDIGLLKRLELVAESRKYIKCSPGEIVPYGEDSQVSRTYYFSGFVSHQSQVRVALTPGVMNVDLKPGKMTVTRGESCAWAAIEPFILDVISRDCKIGPYALKQLTQGNGQ